jgi:hypothetical protein
VISDPIHVKRVSDSYDRNGATNSFSEKEATSFSSNSALSGSYSTSYSSGPRVYESYSKKGISTNDGSHSKDKPLLGYSFINSSFGANGMASTETKSGEFDVSSKMTEQSKFKSYGKISLKALK